MNMLTSNSIQGSESLPQAAPQTDAPTLASSAMLVEVNISHWAGRKKDKRASIDVTYANHAAVVELRSSPVTHRAILQVQPSNVRDAERV